MKTLLKIGVIAALAASLLPAQAILTPTTLSAAVTSAASKTIVVASVTPNGNTLDNFAAGTVVVVDNSLGFVQAVSGLTVTVNWANSSGTRSSTHASGALVWSARPNYLFANVTDPQGGCSRASVQVLPYVNAQTGNVSDCLGSKWVKGPLAPLTQYRVQNPSTGSAVYTGINTNGTTLATTTMYCTEVDLPTNKLLTGIAVLNGTSADGTDKHLVALYDGGGNLIANSALAGTATSGASVFQGIAFTSTYYAVGPAQYFACMQTNGTTNTVRMAVTGSSADNILTKGVTGQTFGTLSAFAAPTTFTTAVGPYVYLY